MADRVLITSSRYFPNVGGIENSIFYLSREFRDNGYEVDVVASDVVEGARVKLPEWEKYDSGVEVHRYSYYLWGRASSLWSYLSGLKKYKSLRRSRRYRYVICRNHVSTVLCKLAGYDNVVYLIPGLVKVQYNPLTSGVKMSAHRLSARLLAYYYHHMLQCLAVRLANRNVVFSKLAEKQLRRDIGYKGSICISKPGVDGERFSPLSKDEKKTARLKYGFVEEDVVLLGVGRFVEAKGFDYLIESLLFLPDNYKLVIVGGGLLADRYNELVERHGLYERVKIFMDCNQPEIFYRLSDIYVLSSIEETLGQTVLEAQASGLPIVAFSPLLPDIQTATDEVTDSQTAVLVDERSPYALAQGVLRTTENIGCLNFDPAYVRLFALRQFSWAGLIDDICSGLV